MTFGNRNCASDRPSGMNSLGHLKLRNRWPNATSVAVVLGVAIVLVGCADKGAPPQPVGTTSSSDAGGTDPRTADERATGETSDPPAQPTTTESPQSDNSSGVFLLADGQKQKGGSGSFCQSVSGVGGFCADSRVVQVPSEPIVLQRGQELVIHTNLDLDPESLTLAVYEADPNASQHDDQINFEFLDHQRLYEEELDPSRDAVFQPRLRSGSYVLVLFGSWSRGDESRQAAYGFNLRITD